MIYFCSQKNRRALVLQSPTLNGIDFVEVPRGADDCGKLILITLLKDARHVALATTQVKISGGTATSQVQPLSVWSGTDAAPRVLTVQLDQSGDFSTYTLSLVANARTVDPPPGFDPQLSTVTFSFKAGCPTVADCLPCDCCPPDTTAPPDINYLAKDYEGFRQVILDRMAVLAPAWAETHVPDIGVALVETLAYAADHLSYQQDAVGTEAYLETARSRISLRRLAKLVDYPIDEGSNARTWAYLKTAADGVLIPSGTLLFTAVPGFATSIFPNTPQAAALLNGPPGFATMRDATLFLEQNAMQLYTWGDSDCCLANGATTATLLGHLSTLAPGDVVLFEEIMGPHTGDPQDANPEHRWAVRLTGVRNTDYLNNPLRDPLLNQFITQIDWAAQDALPFPLCISAAVGSRTLAAVSIARGNMVPADHGVWQDLVLPGTVALTRDSVQVIGRGTTFTNLLQVGEWLVFASDNTQTPYQIDAIANDSLLTLDSPYLGANTASTGAALIQELGSVPAAPPAPVTASSCACTCEGSWPMPLPRYYPKLRNSPVTLAFPLVDAMPASSFRTPASFATSRAIPQVAVYDDQGEPWTVLQDLLSSTEAQRVCVLEREYDGSAFLRFGDGQYGMAPESGMDFHVRYRVGNGTAGNIGRDSLAHVLTRVPGVTEVRNPLPAAGGVDPETLDQIRQQAPFAFRTQLRAVTEDDYRVMAELDSNIREARGTLRWTGSWYTAFVSVDAVAPSGPSAALVVATQARLNLFRMMNVDLAVEGAVIVGLRIEMNICVDPGYFQADVKSMLLQLFTTGILCTGRLGLLNPKNFTFGQTIYTSPLIAAAQGVEGVTSVTMALFQRMDDPSIDGASLGYLSMGRVQIARCDNDPNRLDHGTLVLHMQGGK